MAHSVPIEIIFVWHINLWPFPSNNNHNKTSTRQRGKVLLKALQMYLVEKKIKIDKIPELPSISTL